jgi:hypothetical protein
MCSLAVGRSYLSQLLPSYFGSFGHRPPALALASAPPSFDDAAAGSFIRVSCIALGILQHSVPFPHVEHPFFAPRILR